MTDAAGDPELHALRAHMDALNDRLCDVLEERARLATAIAARKRALGLPLHDPAREDQELRAIQQRACATLDQAARTRIFRVVLDESRRLQAP